MRTTRTTTHDPVCTPNPGGQQAFVEDWQHRFAALEGGWGSGKTWAGARKLLTLHMWNAVGDDGRPTHIPSLAVAPTYPNAMDYVVPEIKDALDEAGLDWDWHTTALDFRLLDLGTRRRPSLIMVRSAEQPKRITGWEVGAIWGDEPARWKYVHGDPLGDPLLQLDGRLRHPRARFLQMMLTYTNEGDTTRVYQEFHSGKIDHALYRAATAENPAVAAFEQVQRANLTAELAAQYLDGGAINLRGQAVYPAFDPARNVSDRVGLQNHLPLHLSLDFNIAPGMHGEVGQYDEDDDRFVVVQEFHASRMSVIDLMRAFVRWVEQTGAWRWPELQVFGDSTGGAKWAATGESCYSIVRQCLERAGFPYRLRVPKSNPPVVDRLNAFNVALSDITGAGHWCCHPRCDRLINDLESLRRGPDGGVDKREAQLSHASDAEGYRVAYVRPARVIRLHEVGGRISV